MENTKKYVVVVTIHDTSGHTYQQVVDRNHCRKENNQLAGEFRSFNMEFHTCPASDQFIPHFKICSKSISDKIVKDIEEWSISGSDADWIEKVEARAVEVEFKF